MADRLMMTLVQSFNKRAFPFDLPKYQKQYAKEQRVLKQIKAGARLLKIVRVGKPRQGDDIKLVPVYFEVVKR